MSDEAAAGPSLARRLVSEPYSLAAAAYFGYGLVYLLGAALAMSPEREVPTFGVVPWWLWFILGSVLTLVGPMLVWRRIRWFTLVLAALHFGQAFAFSLL